MRYSLKKQEICDQNRKNEIFVYTNQNLFMLASMCVAGIL